MKVVYECMIRDSEVNRIQRMIENVLKDEDAISYNVDEGKTIILDEILKGFLRKSTWVRYYNSNLLDNEVLIVEDIGICKVRRITKEFVELWRVKQNV